MTEQVNQNAALEQKIKAGRHTLILLVILTAWNIYSLLEGQGEYLLFSAAVPYYLTLFGFSMDGGVPARFTMIALALAAVILTLYLLCWGLSQKRRGWLVAGLVLVIFDTLVMLALQLLPGAFQIVDLFFHAIAIGELVIAINADGKLRWQTSPDRWDPGDIPTNYHP